MQCHTCGTPVPDGSRYCLSCGRQLSDPSAPTMVSTGAPPSPLLARVREALGSDYVIERELGRGGMAVVFRATETDLRRPVALKVLPPEMALLESLAERFKREARMAASLDHPSVIPIYRVGQSDGVLFMAMKFIDGAPLDAILRTEGRLPVPVVLTVLRAAASALAYAHDHGIVHRDVKGANILVDHDGRVVVTDFGIARAMDDAGVTASGAVIGTPHFMSPEQCAGKHVGPASDQYSLGIVAFQMLAGAVPFDADSIPGIMQHHFFTPVPDLAAVRDDVPPALADVIGRALAKQPDDRFPTTRDLLAALEAIPLAESERRAGETTLAVMARVAGGTVPAPTRSAYDGAPAAPASPHPRAATTVPPARGGGGGGGGAPGVWRELRALLPRTRRDRIVGVIGAAAVLIVLVAALALRRPHHSERDADALHAVALYESGQYARARAAMTRLTVDHPRSAQPHIYLGLIARQQGAQEEAQRQFADAIRLAPGNAWAMREMGTQLYLTQRYDVARRFLVRAVSLDPSDAQAQVDLACTLAALGRDGEAARFFARSGPAGAAGPAACPVLRRTR